MNRTNKVINAGLIALLLAFLLADTAQAAAPVSPPESRFVWEPGENLTFSWTPANFDGFYYDAQSREGNESLTITLDRSRLFGMMKLTKISNTGITVSNIPIDLKRGSIIDIGELELKVADSNTLQVHLYKKWLYVKGEHRGATGSNNITAWDGLNYAGFLYDADSGNYSESLVITNLTGRRIPEGGLTYTSYRLRKVPYAVTNITGKKPEGTDGSYVTFSLCGKKYTARNNGFAELLIAHGDSISEKKTLLGRPPWFEGNDEAGRPVPWGMDTWELGEGYALAVKSIDTMSNPRKARLVLRRNGVELDDVWLSSKNAYRYFQPGETGTPKLITYLDAVFDGATANAIQMRYTWFMSDNVTQIKEGDRFGVFNVTVVESDRMVLKNSVPVELRAGSSINLFGNLSFFVENSDELRFYPTNRAGTPVIPEEVTGNAVRETPDVTTSAGTSLVAGRTEKTSGFESVLSIAIILALYITGRKIR